MRELLRRIRAADSDAQKSLRFRLRNEVGFFITDFAKSNAGFSVADLQTRRASGDHNRMKTRAGEKDDELSELSVYQSKAQTDSVRR
ncbi:hypothetical protein AB4Y43_16675 [Paraburkholderia sp. BR10872]|uniref:hypothetical protein n=1 Tax=Paraburkholderia sp. BR10872 TaxID=3236989 RepID=UPI0034D22778